MKKTKLFATGNIIQSLLEAHYPERVTYESVESALDKVTTESVARTCVCERISDSSKKLYGMSWSILLGKNPTRAVWLAVLDDAL